jgi:hypothetical protein
VIGPAHVFPDTRGAQVGRLSLLDDLSHPPAELPHPALLSERAGGRSPVTGAVGGQPATLCYDAWYHHTGRVFSWMTHAKEARLDDYFLPKFVATTQEIHHAQERPLRRELPVRRRPAWPACSSLTSRRVYWPKKSRWCCLRSSQAIRSRMSPFR